MNFRSKLLLASLISMPLAACGDDGGGTTSDASTGNATPATTTNPTTTTDPGTTAATEPETTAATTEPDTTNGPTTTDPGTTDPGTTDLPTTDGTTDPGTTDPGTTTDAETTGVQGLSWAVDVYPVLNPPISCDCHTPGSGGLKMGDPVTSYMNLVDVKSAQSMLDRVEPSDPEASYFLHKLNGTHVDVGGSGSKMPLGAPELPQETRDLIEQWITEGAQP